MLKLPTHSGFHDLFLNQTVTLDLILSILLITNYLSPQTKFGDLLCLHCFLLLLFFLSSAKSLSDTFLGDYCRFFLAYIVPLDVDVVPNKFDQFLLGK
jgi:hypothetical protein